MRSRNINFLARRTLFYLILALVAASFFFPFLWVVFTSLQDAQSAAEVPPRFPFMPTFDNFRQVIEEAEFINSLWNSTVVVFMTLAANLIISLPAAYIIARYRRQWLMFIIMFLYFYCPGTLSSNSSVFMTLISAWCCPT